MKVVLFCGGLGMRIRDAEEHVPKPMVTIGSRPILWHVMKYYAHYGHKDFILCLGHRGHIIKDYFLNYSEWLSNDFVLSDGGKSVQLMSSDLDGWRIRFVDTGMTANIGQRLKAVEPLLADEPEFFANYSDGLTDLVLPQQLDHFRRHRAVASFLSVRPPLSYHLVTTEPDGLVTSIEDIKQTGIRINGGFFIFRNAIFDHLGTGEDLVREPFQRVVRLKALVAYEHDGFWMAMDTFKDRQQLAEIHAGGNPPWQVWNRPAGSLSTILGNVCPS